MLKRLSLSPPERRACRRRHRRGGAVLVSLALLLPAIQHGVGLRAASADPVATNKRLIEEFRVAQRTTRGKGVTIAILSTGVEAKGPLKGVVKHQHDLVGSKGPARLSGTIAAVALAGRGPTPDGRFIIRGLVPAADLMSVRIRPEEIERGAEDFYEQERDRESTPEGIRYAADHGADVILVDHALPTTEQEDLGGAVAFAHSKNAIVVAGHRHYTTEGNYSPWVTYPASVPGVIGVADLDPRGRPSGSWSGRDSAVLVSAPGVQLPSAAATKDLGDVWGPLVAAISVTATAAMIRSEYPDLPPRLVGEAISRSAHHPKGGYDTTVGFGVINPGAAMKEAGKLQDAPTVTVACSGSVGDRVRFGGMAPDTLRAVQWDTARLAGFGGLAAGGLAALVLAMVIFGRARRRTTDSTAGDGAGRPVAASGGTPVVTDGPTDTE